MQTSILLQLWHETKLPEVNYPQTIPLLSCTKSAYGYRIVSRDTVHVARSVL
jgi:hypothetical protein